MSAPRILHRLLCFFRIHDWATFSPAAQINPKKIVIIHPKPGHFARRCRWCLAYRYFPHPPVKP